jgi:hypothetical protein
MPTAWKRRHRQSMPKANDPCLPSSRETHLRGSIQYSPHRHQHSPQHSHYHQKHLHGVLYTSPFALDEAAELPLRNHILIQLYQSLIRQQDLGAAASVTPVTAGLKVHPDYAEVEVECVTSVIRLLLRLHYSTCRDQVHRLLKSLPEILPSHQLPPAKTSLPSTWKDFGSILRIQLSIAFGKALSVASGDFHHKVNRGGSAIVGILRCEVSLQDPLRPVFQAKPDSLLAVHMASSQHYHRPNPGLDGTLHHSPHLAKTIIPLHLISSIALVARFPLAEELPAVVHRWNMTFLGFSWMERRPRTKAIVSQHPQFLS